MVVESQYFVHGCSSRFVKARVSIGFRGLGFRGLGFRI